MKVNGLSEKIEAKDTNFYTKKSINVAGKLLTFDSPKVMGILNITPDSFYDGGKYVVEKTIVEQTQRMLEEGADIIDVGASSTKPGAALLEPKEELKRLSSALKIITTNFPEAILSIDTFQSEVAKAGIDLGGHIVNDVSGGTMDKNMPKTIGALKVPYILMHMQGTPQTMQHSPVYKDVFKDVSYYFSKQMNLFFEQGVNDIILDPGFGFGKTVEHNYQLLNQLADFKIFERPMLVGFSRKSMINKVLGTTPRDALNGTTVLNTMALERGANLLRVHDVKEAVEAVKIFNLTQNLA